MSIIDDVRIKQTFDPEGESGGYRCDRKVDESQDAYFTTTQFSDWFDLDAAISKPDTVGAALERMGFPSSGVVKGYVTPAEVDRAAEIAKVAVKYYFGEVEPVSDEDNPHKPFADGGPYLKGPKFKTSVYKIEALEHSPSVNMILDIKTADADAFKGNQQMLQDSIREAIARSCHGFSSTDGTQVF